LQGREKTNAGESYSQRKGKIRREVKEGGRGRHRSQTGCSWVHLKKKKSLRGEELLYIRNATKGKICWKLAGEANIPKGGPIPEPLKKNSFGGEISG